MARPALDFVELMVLFENRLQVLIGNTDAGVPDLDAKRAPATAAAEQHLAVFGVFQCVREQIADHLLQKARVAADRYAATDHPECKASRPSVIAELVLKPFEEVVD